MFHKPFVFCFGFENINRTFLPTLKPLNILHGAFFLVCLHTNRFFLLFSGILSSKCSSGTYLVAIYTVNTPSTSCCWFITTENVWFIFDNMIWTSKHQPYHFSIFEISKYVRLCLGCSFFPCKYIISLCSLHSKYTKHTLLFVCNQWKRSIYLWCYDLDFKRTTVLFSIFETSKYFRWHLVFCLFASKNIISALFRHFNF